MKLPDLLRGRAAWWVGTAVVLGLLAVLSLEEVTAEPPPLDPRFYAGGGTSAVGPGPGLVPFADYDGDTVTVSGTVEAPAAGAMDLDLWKVDPDAPGSRSHLGKIPQEGPGPFEILVPVDFGKLQIEAFLDQTGDGPSMDDPFGRVACDVGAEPVTELELVLEEGGMGKHHGGPPPSGEGSPEGTPEGGPEHLEMPPGGVGGESGAEHSEAEPGAPGGEAQEHVEMPPGGGDGGTPGDNEGGGGKEHVEMPPGGAAADGGVEHREAAPGTGRDPFASAEGPRVKVSGTIHFSDAAAVLDLDLFREDPGGPGGRVFVGKKKVTAGGFELAVPVAFEKISMEVFHDATGDGPSMDDPFAACPCNPVNLRRGDVDGIEIRVE